MKQFKEFVFVDSPGFFDPQNLNSELWQKYILILQDDIRKTKILKNGVAAIIVPIMVPNHKRVDSMTIDVIFEILLAFNLVNPQFLKKAEKGEVAPKIIIVLNNFSLVEKSKKSKEEKEVMSSDTSDEPSSQPQKVWFKEIQQTIRSHLAHKICEYILYNNLDMDNPSLNRDHKIPE